MTHRPIDKAEIPPVQRPGPKCRENGPTATVMQFIQSPDPTHEIDVPEGQKPVTVVVGLHTVIRRKSLPARVYRRGDRVFLEKL